jgi:hypothetical protein
LGGVSADRRHDDDAAERLLDPDRLSVTLDHLRQLVGDPRRVDVYIPACSAIHPGDYAAKPLPVRESLCAKTGSGSLD